MTDKTRLGDRMKRYEAVTRAVLPRRTYTIIRVDGRSFHSYLRGAVKPYDAEFMAAMDTTAEELCREIAGAQFAFVQSDEISVLATDFATLNTEPWFGGVVQKMVSVSAARASVTLSRIRADRAPALFDSRVFTIPDPGEVADYFIWRQRDCVKNSIAMAAQAVFSQRELHGVNTSQMQEMLWQKAGVNWDDYEAGEKRGRLVRKKSFDSTALVPQRGGEPQEVPVTRSAWVAEGAPRFAFEADNALLDLIPRYFPSAVTAPGTPSEGADV